MERQSENLASCLSLSLSLFLVSRGEIVSGKKVLTFLSSVSFSFSTKTGGTGAIYVVMASTEEAFFILYLPPFRPP